MHNGEETRSRDRPVPTPSGERLPRAARLRGEDEIRRTLKSGRRRVRGPIEVYLAPSPASRPRLAVIVPLHGHGAVERNRLRRRLREILRVEWLPRAWEPGAPLDLAVRTRPSAYDCSFSQLRTFLIEALDDGV